MLLGNTIGLLGGGRTRERLVYVLYWYQNVQILTQNALLAEVSSEPCNTAVAALLAGLLALLGTNVHILTQKALGQAIQSVCSAAGGHVSDWWFSATHSLTHTRTCMVQWQMQSKMGRRRGRRGRRGGAVTLWGWGAGSGEGG